MRRVGALAFLFCAAGIGAAAPPVALSQVAPGLWELSGVPGARVPVRQCFSDPMTLTQYEHRGRVCSRTVVSDRPGSTVINYDCGTAGFGHSEIEVLTPRSLRVSTQGISNQSPFGYTLQARWAGECKASDPPHH